VGSKAGKNLVVCDYEGAGMHILPINVEGVQTLFLFFLVGSLFSGVSCFAYGHLHSTGMR
jgi:hypothetical protein